MTRQSVQRASGHRRVKIDLNMFLRRFPASSDGSIDESDIGDISGTGIAFLASGESVDVERGWWVKGGRLTRSSNSSMVAEVGVGKGEGMGG